MNVDAIIARINRMLDRESLSRIIHAAQARTDRLASIESKAAQKKAFDKRCSGLKKGDTIYIHDKKYNSRGIYSPMFGKPIEVLMVKPRSKEVIVRSFDRHDKPAEYVMPALLLERAKVSKVPTPQALQWALERSK